MYFTKRFPLESHRTDGGPISLITVAVEKTVLRPDALATSESWPIARLTITCALARQRSSAQRRTHASPGRTESHSQTGVRGPTSDRKFIEIDHTATVSVAVSAPAQLTLARRAGSWIVGIVG